jgi:transposase
MSNNKTRQVYTSEFKREAIELARTSGKPVTELAPRGHPELGLSQGLLKYWIRQAKTEGETAFPGQGRLKPADEELRRLQREVEILRQERDLLKKVVAIFSHDPPRNTRS